MKRCSPRKDSDSRPSATKDSGISTKLDLATAINNAIDEEKLSQTQAATLLGIPQPKISALANYRLNGFSVQRLFRILNALGRDVVIRVGRKQETAPTGKTLVRAA